MFVLVYCLWKRKRGKADYTQSENEGGYEEPTQNAQPGENSPQNGDLPTVPGVEGIYEEPAQYAQLDNSKRVTIDGNYQSLNITKPGRSLNEDVEEHVPLRINNNPENDAASNLV